MRSRPRNTAGLSEIVGTLMLIVIVVSAATLLAAFVATYQAQVQKEQAYSHDQSLESIHILGLTSKVSDGNFTNLSFTMASEDVDPTILLGIAVNGLPLLDYAYENLSAPGSWHEQTFGATQTLGPEEEILVATHIDAFGSIASSFITPGGLPLPNQFIKFDVYTVLQNDFTRVFLPPNPLAIASQTNPSGTNNLTILDGSTSFQPGGNASIVAWDWSVTGGILGTQSTTAVITSPAGGPTISGTGTATFQVPNGFAFGTGTTYSIAFSPGQPQVSGAGCNLVSPAPTIMAPSPTLMGTTLTVMFSYSATVSLATGCGLSVSPNGITLVMPGGSAQVEAFSGEEIEVSPALPFLSTLDGDVGFPYQIALTVVSSNGLEGTSTVSFIPPGSA